MSGAHVPDHDHDDAHGHAPPAKDEKIHSYYQLLGLALKDLLIEKGVLSAEEIRKTIEFRDSITPALGAKIVARAWSDPVPPPAGRIVLPHGRTARGGHEALQGRGRVPRG